MGKVGKDGHILERHKSSTEMSEVQHLPRPQKIQFQEVNTVEAAAVFRRSQWNVSVPPKDSTPSHFSLVLHALVASSAQILAAVVSEEELDAISPVLGASSTQSLVGWETAARIYSTVRKSPSPSLPVLVHVCTLTSMILTIGTQTSARCTLLQAA